MANAKVDGQAEVLASIEQMPGTDRMLAERLHEIVSEVAPDLTPRLWYGMPAYAKNGKVIVFYQSAAKFKTRYATLGFQHEAQLDDGNMWPVAYALIDMSDAEAARIAELVKKAVG